MSLCTPRQERVNRFAVRALKGIPKNALDMAALPILQIPYHASEGLGTADFCHRGCYPRKVGEMEVHKTEIIKKDRVLVV